MNEKGKISALGFHQVVWWKSRFMYPYPEKQRGCS